MLQLSPAELYGHGKFRIAVAFKILLSLCQSKITNPMYCSPVLSHNHTTMVTACSLLWAQFFKADFRLGGYTWVYYFELGR